MELEGGQGEEGHGQREGQLWPLQRLRTLPGQEERRGCARQKDQLCEGIKAWSTLFGKWPEPQSGRAVWWMEQ